MAQRLSIDVIVGLIDRLSRPLRGLESKMKATMAVGAGMAAMGVSILASLRPAVIAFADAEEAVTDLKVAMMETGGAVPPAFGAIAQLAEELGDKLPGTTAEFDQMMTMLRRQGVAADTVLQGTGKAAAYLAVMLKMGPPAAAEFAAKLQDATGTTAKDMVALADTIQRGFFLGIDPSNMLGAFSAAAPGMAAIKQQGLAGAQALAPLIAMLDQASLTGESAGNALRQVFQRSFNTDKIKEVDKVLKLQGKKPLNLRFSTQGEFAGLDNLFAQLDKLKALSTEDRLDVIKSIYGDDSQVMQALNTMIEKGKGGYDEMRKKMQDQADLQTRINTLLGTLKNVWDAASGSFTNLLASVGELLGPDLKRLAEWFGELSVKIKGWIKANPELARTIARVTAIVAVALVALGALGITFGVIGLAIGPLIAVIGALVSPVGLVIAGIALLIAAFMNWERVCKWAAKAWDWLIKKLGWDPMTVIPAKWNGIRDYFKSLFSDIVLWASDMIEAFANLGGRMVEGLKTGISNAWGSMRAWFGGKVNELPATANNELEVRSPSRVFARLGNNIVRGLEVGIQGRAGYPLAHIQDLVGNLTRTAGALALSGGLVALPAAAAPPGRASGGGPSIVINMPITINAPPGTDTQALAALVRQAVQGATRQAAGRIAALYDRGDGL